MIGGLKTVNLAWVNEIAVIGCTRFFVYESALTYEGRMNAAPVLFLDMMCRAKVPTFDHIDSIRYESVRLDPIQPCPALTLFNASFLRRVRKYEDEFCYF